jgi:hypothetical protein
MSDRKCVIKPVGEPNRPGGAMRGDAFDKSERFHSGVSKQNRQPDVRRSHMKIRRRLTFLLDEQMVRFL